MAKVQLGGVVEFGGDLDTADKQFRDAFTDLRVFADQISLTDRLRKRRWVLGPKGYERDGVFLLSNEGFQADRDSFALFRAIRGSLNLYILLEGADKKRIRDLRVAFEAGRAHSDCMAYRAMVKGRGRPKGSDLKRIFVQLDMAERKWRKENRDKTRRPTAAELAKLVMNIAARGKTFANIVSKWRASRSPKK